MEVTEEAEQDSSIRDSATEKNIDYTQEQSADSMPVALQTEVKNGLVNEGNVFKYYENNVWIRNKYGFVSITIIHFWLLMVYLQK